MLNLAQIKHLLEAIRETEIASKHFGDDAITTSPPSVTLTIKDSEGREWTENFYVGEPGKFDYPTGLISDEKKPEKVEEGL